jgi:amino acid transporter
MIAVVGMFFAGMASMTSCSRLVFAFGRDGGLPASSVWRRLSGESRTPVNAVWLTAVASFLLGLPYLWSSAAFAATTSISVVGLYIGYVLPVLARLLPGARPAAGPWTLGRWSRPIGIVAVLWVAFISVLFLLPTSSPVTGSTFNYTSVAVLVVLLFAGGWWVLGARRSFGGPPAIEPTGER